MEENSFDIGMVGLGVMGRSFMLNIADNGYAVAGLDNKKDQADALAKEADQHEVSGTTDAEVFISSLKKPRAVMMLVPSGKAVDSVINEMLPLLDEGDLIIDGGNSHFSDTNRRFKNLEKEGIYYMGVGISGGEKGARSGPSIMPGGSEEAYDRVQSIFEAAAAKVGDEPCVKWLGPRSAGHYVKMVHNGIEYGLMQLIGECYDLMKRGLGFSNERLHEVFSEWNDGELSSYLIEITADIFAQPDDKGDGMLIDAVLDNAKQKGTGKWASQDAMNLKAPTPTIDMAVVMRDLSSYKEERVHADQVLKGPDASFDGDAEEVVSELRNAMYFAMITTYAQGMSMLLAASDEYDYDLNFEDIAKIWRGGCIIRADLLEDISMAFNNDPDLTNILIDKTLLEVNNKHQSDVRSVTKLAADLGIPAPGMMSALAYYDGYRSEHLPANLIQAQRDYFGSHTFERKDQDGTFHSEWNHNS